jgi:hypothetical protein
VSALATSARTSFDHAFEAQPPDIASDATAASAPSEWFGWKRSLVRMLAFDAALREFNPGPVVGSMGDVQRMNIDRD